MPVLADGFISAVAALCAVRLCPAAAKAVLASHVSAEPAGMLLLDALRKKPLITAGMRLGEGTGAVAAMPLLDMARAVYMDCYTFEEGGIEAYTPQGGELLNAGEERGGWDVHTGRGRRGVRQKRILPSS